MAHKNTKQKKSGANLLQRLDQLDADQTKRMKRKAAATRARKRNKSSKQGSLRGLFIAIAASLLLPFFIISQAPNGFLPPLAGVLFVIVLLWPLTLPAAIAIIALGIKRQYNLAIGVVIATFIVCALILSSGLI